MNFIELKHITKRYGQQVAVNDVSLSIEEGDLLVLLGRSGCGKTTMLRLIAGLERPESGEIWLAGQPVSRGNLWVPAEERRVGMVFQDYALFPHIDVLNNVTFGINGQRKEKQKRALEVLELVGLAGYEKRMPHELSGGQQQRVALARALAPQPHVLLLDEPFSNLDAALRTQVRSEVRDILREAGTTSVFVTHDQEEALSLSDKVAVMFGGELAQMGTPFELYTRPNSKRVASFIGESNLIPAQAHGNHANSPLGQVRLLQPQQGEVELLIRPEMLHLLPTDEGTVATVLWREYYGHNQRIGLRLEDGTELVARQDAQIVYEVGQQVRVSVYAPLLAF